MKVKYLVAGFMCIAVGSVQANGCHDSTTFGSWFDGEAVADNPNGQDYSADSGIVGMIGCTRFLGDSHLYTGNFSLGYRYQIDNSGRGRSQGAHVEASLGMRLGPMVLGGGGIYQFSGKVVDFDGLRTSIEPSAGVFAYLGLSLKPGLELQVRQHAITFESDDGDEFAGAEFGLFLHQAF